MKFALLTLVIAFLFQSFTSFAQTGEEAKDTALDPYVFDGRYDHYWGYIGSKIYKQKPSADKWDYVLTLPFATTNSHLQIKDRNTIALFRNDDSLICYRISEAKVDRTTQKELFDSFCASDIKKIIFSEGGDRNNDPDGESIVYILKGELFVLSPESLQSVSHFFYFKDNTVAIDTQLVAAFVKKIPAIYNKRATIDSLGFTPSAYDSCKRNILAYKTFLETAPDKRKWEEHQFYCYNDFPDFNKLLALVDTLKTIDREFLDHYFLQPDDLDQKGYWPSNPTLKLVNTKDEVLEIKSLYELHNARYLPWVIKLNGLFFTNMSVEINDFLKSVAPKFLYCDTPIDLMQDLVRQLYRRWELANKK